MIAYRLPIAAAAFFALLIPCAMRLASAQGSRASATGLHLAAQNGDIRALRAIANTKADLNSLDAKGRTALLVAVENGQLESAQFLVEHGADLNVSHRGSGTALEAAERAGHSAIAALLRKAGARSSGHSVGDKVCVRPWAGDGYCGTVESVDKTAYRLRVTEIIGCKTGCAAKPECSGGKPVGTSDGIHPGDTVQTVSWCLTHTGVAQ